MIFLIYIYIYITCTQLKHTSQAINKQFNINVCCNFISTVFLYILHIYFLIIFFKVHKTLNNNTFYTYFAHIYKTRIDGMNLFPL